MQIQIANKNIKLNILAFVRTFKQSEFVIDAILFNTLDAPPSCAFRPPLVPPTEVWGRPKKAHVTPLCLYIE